MENNSNNNQNICTECLKAPAKYFDPRALCLDCWREWWDSEYDEEYDQNEFAEYENDKRKND